MNFNAYATARYKTKVNLTEFIAFLKDGLVR
jgi:hypothetical protein